MLDANIEVLVMTCGEKPSVTLEQLTEAGVPYQEYKNPDWDLPEAHPEHLVNRAHRPNVRHYAIRQYRAFRGHQEMCRMATTPFTLIFEDDANPNIPTDEWTRLINRCKSFIANGRYDAVSFHGRNMRGSLKIVTALFEKSFGDLTPIDIPNGHHFFLQPAREYAWKGMADQLKWHEGCLAYLIGNAGRRQWIAARDGGGMPCDLFLVNGLRTLVLAEEQTIFDHDERYGSVISTKIDEGAVK